MSSNDYLIAKYVHVIGAVLLGGGLIAVWLCDLRGRRLREIVRYSEAVRYVAIFYDGVVVPGAILCGTSGAWMVAHLGGISAIFKQPWLAGMVGLAIFEVIEGNTITRLYIRKLRRLTITALRSGAFTAELEETRGSSHTPHFTHFLDMPLFFVFVALGVLRPESWRLFGIGTALSILIAAALTYYIPRLEPVAVESELAAVASSPDRASARQSA